MAQATCEMVTIKQEASTFVWATNPCLNPTGNKIAYQSSRRTKEGTIIQEIRMLDLMSGDDRVIVEGARLIDWQDKHSVIFQYTETATRAGKAVYNLNLSQVQYLQ